MLELANLENKIKNFDIDIWFKILKNAKNNLSFILL